jgi:putative tributyrin esterase
MLSLETSLFLVKNSKKSFRTVELSPPLPELPGLHFITVKSKALKQRADITVFLPKTSTPPEQLPLVILLHGVYGSHWAWCLKGQAHKTLQRMIDQKKIPPMALAMPSDGLWGDGSGYVPHRNQNFEKWIIDEVPLVVREQLGISQPKK